MGGSGALSPPLQKGGLGGILSTVGPQREAHAVRVNLTSGGWWELETRPRWEQMRGILTETAQGREDEAGLAEQVLLALTTAWSFTEEVSVASLARRDPRDTAAAMNVLEHEVGSLGAGRRPKEHAEGLFQGLAAGAVPDEFAEVHIFAHTGWTWQELQETPADIVRKMAVYLAVKLARDSGGTLDFPER